MQLLLAVLASASAVRLCAHGGGLVASATPGRLVPTLPLLLPRCQPPRCAAGEAAAAAEPASAGSPPAVAGAYFKPLQEGDVLESTSKHQAICATATALVAALLAKAALLFASGQTPLSLGWFAFTLFAGLEFADFGSGVYHWSMDNYGNAHTPVWGKQIEAFHGGGGGSERREG